MSYHQKLIALRSECWTAFEKLVRSGALFPELIDVFYPSGSQIEGLSKTTDGRNWFYATELKADANYTLLIGEDLIVAAHPVTFLDAKGKPHTLHPDILDLYWLSELLDAARIP